MIGTEYRIITNITPSTFRNAITWVVFIVLLKQGISRKKRTYLFSMYCVLILDLAVCEHSVIKWLKPSVFCIIAKAQLFWSALEHYTQLVLNKWNVAWTVLNTCSPDWKAVLKHKHKHKAQKKAMRL